MQMLSFYNAFLAVLALASLVTALTLFLVPRARSRVRASFRAHELLAAGAVVAAVATAGSLTYSEIVGYQPCFLCWVQRGFMYPLVLIAGATAVVSRRKPGSRAWLATAVVALGGFCVSVWHYLEQVFPDLSAGVCTVGVPCSGRYVNVFGFVTIPFMAGCGFLVIAALALTSARSRQSSETRPAAVDAATT